MFESRFLSAAQKDAFIKSKHQTFSYCFLLVPLLLDTVVNIQGARLQRRAQYEIEITVSRMSLDL